MNDIQHLITIVKKKGQRSLQLVNFNFRKKETSKDNLLYEGIVNETFTTDQAAAKAVFKASPSNRNYRNAKGKLKAKLLNHLFFLDYEKDSYTLYEKTRYECQQSLLQSKILINEEAAYIALKLLPSLIRTAEEFELYNVVVEALILLRDEHARLGKVTPFAEANEALEKYRKLWAVDQECHDLYYQTLAHINKSVSAQKRVASQIPKNIQHIEQAAQKHKSQSMQIMADKLQLLYNAMQWDFKSNIQRCTELEKKYLNKPNQEVKVNLRKKEVAFTKVDAYLHAPENAEAAQYAKKTLKLFKPSAYDWFTFAEYYFLLLMKQEAYQPAADLFRKVRTNKLFGSLEEDVTHRWQIYRAYLIFFNDTKILRWGFNLEEFIRTPPQYEKDHDGYALATLVIQLMFLLREGYVDDLKACVEKLSQYKSAHLDKRNNYRSSIFIRLLEIIVEKDFNYERIEEKGDNYHRKLINTPIPRDITQEIEVVPYEKLWVHVLGILRANRTYVHYRFYSAKAI